MRICVLGAKCEHWDSDAYGGHCMIAGGGECVKVDLIYGYVLTNRVKKFRLEKGLTQDQLAFQVGVSRNSIASIEKCTFYPTLSTAFKIAYALDKPIEEVFIFQWTKTRLNQEHLG